MPFLRIEIIESASPLHLYLNKSSNSLKNVPSSNVAFLRAREAKKGKVRLWQRCDILKREGDLLDEFCDVDDLALVEGIIGGEGEGG